MFINDSHLPQLLSAEHYISAEQHEREVERLFLPGWHCIGLLSELPRDGDYLTLELLGRPLIAWRSGGEVHTFLNVCSHRSSNLRSERCGHVGDQLKCQYHGWEYDETGNTRKIPDAKSFRPMKPGLLGLTKFRTEMCGQLIFMTFNDEAPSLREWLGPMFELAEGWYTPDHGQLLVDDSEHDANWKVVVENFLEGYHLECIHPTTFGTFPDESRCTHEFHEEWDWYRDNYSREGNRMERLICRGAGVEPQYTWHHLLRYPNIIFGVMALFNFAQTIVPIAPGRCRVMTRFVVYPGRRGRVRTWLMRKLLRAWGRRFWKKVIAEDGSIFPSVQRGLSSPEHPKGGLISIREERIFPFQQYILENTSGGVCSGSSPRRHAGTQKAPKVTSDCAALSVSPGLRG